MSDTRKPASKTEEGFVMAFFGALAMFIGVRADQKVPGIGEPTAAGVVAVGAIAANWLRDRLGLH